MALEAKDLLDRNLELFLKMKDLAQQQAELAENEDMDQFFRLSSKRTRLQQEISRNERRYGGESAVAGNQSAALNMRAASEEVTRIIESIQDIDRTIERIIQDKKEDVQSDIKRTRRGQAAVKGYGPRHPKHPKFLNRKS